MNYIVGPSVLAENSKREVRYVIPSTLKAQRIKCLELHKTLHRR
jgi:hypothetical protein